LPNFALAAGFTDACAAKRRISGCCTTSTPCANRTTAVSVDKPRLARTIVIRFRPPERNCDCSMLPADFGGDPGPWSGGTVPAAVITRGCGPNVCYSMTSSALRPEFCDSHISPLSCAAMRETRRPARTSAFSATARRQIVHGSRWRWSSVSEAVDGLAGGRVCPFFANSATLVQRG
jgi:hypothetical protein